MPLAFSRIVGLLFENLVQLGALFGQPSHLRRQTRLTALEPALLLAERFLLLLQQLVAAIELLLALHVGLAACGEFVLRSHLDRQRRFLRLQQPLASFGLRLPTGRIEKPVSLFA